MTEAAPTQTRHEGVSITIKTGKGYDDSWLGFTGSVEQVRANIIDTFRMDHQEDLPLFEVVANATQIAHGVVRAVSALGGTVVQPHATGTLATTSGSDEAQQQTGNTEPAAEADPYEVLDKQIHSEDMTIDSLRRLYADNTELFTADTLAAKAAKKAWSARGRALSTSA